MNRKSFTMIEMLGVLAIIVILAGLLFPAISAAIDKSKRTKTRAAIKNLQVAINSYKATYGYLPFTNPDAAADRKLLYWEYDELLDCLAATNLSTDNNLYQFNPRKIKFLDCKFEGGTPTYKDAWNRDLNVSLDLTYDNKVTDSDVIGYISGDLNSTMAIWSQGKDGLFSATDGADENKDNVTSWD